MQKKSALANVAAAGNAIRTKELTMVPVPDGNIVHSSDLNSDEMLQALMANPAIQPFGLEGNAAVVQA